MSRNQTARASAGGSSRLMHCGQTWFWCSLWEPSRFPVMVARSQSAATFAWSRSIVALAPISDPELVAATIARTLGIRDLGGRPVLDSMRELPAGPSALAGPGQLRSGSLGGVDDQRRARGLSRAQDPGDQPSTARAPGGARASDAFPRSVGHG